VSDNEERLVAEIPSNLKERVNADPRDIKEVVIDALKTEFCTADDAAVRRRIDEKETRIANVRSERNQRNRELEELQSELESLKTQLQTSEDIEQAKQDAIDERLEALQDVRGTVDESHPTVEALAREHFSNDRTAALEAMQERNDELNLVPGEYL